MLFSLQRYSEKNWIDGRRLTVLDINLMSYNVSQSYTSVVPVCNLWYVESRICPRRWSDCRSYHRVKELIGERGYFATDSSFPDRSGSFQLSSMVSMAVICDESRNGRYFAIWDSLLLFRMSSKVSSSSSSWSACPKVR